MTMELHLRNGGPALIDEADAPLLGNWGWHVTSNGYVGAMTTRAKGAPPRTMILLHRLLMQPPDGMQVDHINGNTLDNRRENLRVVTGSANLRNQHRIRSNNKSGVLGVCSRDGFWRATIRVEGRQVGLGQYPDIESAAQARWDAELRYFGHLFPMSQEARLYLLRNGTLSDRRAA